MQSCTVRFRRSEGSSVVAGEVVEVMSVDVVYLANETLRSEILKVRPKIFDLRFSALEVKTELIPC